MKLLYKLRSVIFTLLFLLALFFILNSTALTHLPFYASGSGDTQLKNMTALCADGGHFVITDKLSSQDSAILISKLNNEADLFWLHPSYHTLSLGKYSFFIFRDKYDNREQLQKDIKTEADNIISEIITENMTEYDKTLAIHDWICENINYDEANSHTDQDIYGALILRKAKCAGYAKSFSYLLDLVGIDSQVISGDAVSNSGKRSSHAWNIAYIDGEPYYFDLTWNDEDDDTYTHNWFGITRAEFEINHEPYAGYDWVDADATAACYYIKNDMYLEKYSAKNLAEQIKKQGYTFSVKCASAEVLDQTIAALKDGKEQQEMLKYANITTISQFNYRVTQHVNCLTVEFIP